MRFLRILAISWVAVIAWRGVAVCRAREDIYNILHPKPPAHQLTARDEAQHIVGIYASESMAPKFPESASRRLVQMTTFLGQKMTCNLPQHPSVADMGELTAALSSQSVEQKLATVTPDKEQSPASNIGGPSESGASAEESRALSSEGDDTNSADSPTDDTSTSGDSTEAHNKVTQAAPDENTASSRANVKPSVGEGEVSETSHSSDISSTDASGNSQSSGNIRSGYRTRDGYEAHESRSSSSRSSSSSSSSSTTTRSTTTTYTDPETGETTTKTTGGTTYSSSSKHSQAATGDKPSTSGGDTQQIEGNVAQDVVVQDEEEVEEESLETIATQLEEGLDGKCFTKRQGYWTYRVCPFDRVEHYHVDPRTKKEGKPILLGTYNAERSRGIKSSYAGYSSSHKYTDGSGGRRTKLRMRCPLIDDHKTSDGSIQSINEHPKLNYEIVLLTRHVCSQKDLAKAKQEREASTKTKPSQQPQQQPKSGQNQNHPAANSRNQRPAAQQYEPIKDPTDVVELLSPLGSQPCLPFQKDFWWTFEFCYLSQVTQYHDEVTKKGGKSGQSTSQRTMEFLLGRFAGIDDVHAATTLTVGERPEQSFVTQHYPGGDTCDLTGEPRDVVLRYQCSKPEDKSRRGTSKILSVEETSTCKYRVTVGTSLLCQHPDFKPKEKVTEKIVCYPTPPQPEPEVQPEPESDNENGEENVVSSERDNNGVENPEDPVDFDTMDEHPALNEGDEGRHLAHEDPPVDLDDESEAIMIGGQRW